MLAHKFKTIIYLYIYKFFFFLFHKIIGIYKILFHAHAQVQCKDASRISTSIKTNVLKKIELKQ